MNEYTTNQPIGSTCDGKSYGVTDSKAVLKNFCGECGSVFQSYEQEYYDEYTGKKVFKWGCSKYGCTEHCRMIGRCIYTKKHFWSEAFCERCGRIY